MSDLNLSSTFSEDGSICTITVGGRLAIDTAQALLELFGETRQHSSIRLDLSRLEDIDLSGLQLICSACRTNLSSSKKFHITGSYPAALTKAVSDTGLDSQASCRQYPDIQCIWHEGAH